MMDDFLSDEERAFFNQEMAGVKPLKNKKDVLVKKCIKNMTTTIYSSLVEEYMVIEQADFYLSDYYHDPVGSEEILSYCKHVIPKKYLNELRHGLIPCKAKLDLHGLKRDMAKQVLIKFISKQITLSNRCFLIIHGKGSHNNEVPILKNLVNHWLPQFPQVLAFHTAIPCDGGSGALYVLLKRQRPIAKAKLTI